MEGAMEVKLSNSTCLLIVATLAPFNIVASSQAEETGDFVKCFKAQMQEADRARAAKNKGDYAGALRILREGAARGNPFAKSALCIFHVSESVPKSFRDPVEAKRICGQLAQEDSAADQNILGRMYLTGWGVKKDEHEALYWFRKSAEQGMTDSQYLLGLGHFVGRGVPRDFVSAYMWLNLAGASGHEEARKRLNTLHNVMTPNAISEAQSLSRQWKPRESEYRQDDNPCFSEQ